MNHYTEGKWALRNYMNHLSEPGYSSVIVWLQDLLPRAARSRSRGVALTSAITCSARFKRRGSLARVNPVQPSQRLLIGKPIKMSVIPLATNPRWHLQRKTLPLPETLLHLNMDHPVYFWRELLEQVQTKPLEAGLVETVAASFGKQPSVTPPVSLPPRQVIEDSFGWKL